jgi:hypothetical protein
MKISSNWEMKIHMNILTKLVLFAQQHVATSQIKDGIPAKFVILIKATTKNAK